MKQVILGILFLAPSAYIYCQNKSTFHSDKDPATEQAIKKMEYLLADLIMKGDIDTYSGYLTDDYIRVTANGNISTKQQVLEGFRKSKMQGTMAPHDLNVRIYGNTAILQGILDLQSQKGDTITKRTSVITKVFIKKDGKWYMASMQGSPVQ